MGETLQQPACEKTTRRTGVTPPGRTVGNLASNEVIPPDSNSDESYDPHSFTPFAVCVDLVALTIKNGVAQVLLVQRGNEPFKGLWALPGGFVQEDESLLDAAARKLWEKTAVNVDSTHLEQLETFGNPNRDSRMRVVSVAHLALLCEVNEVTSSGGGAVDSRWFDLSEWSKGKLGRLAFDHDEILASGLERARAKLEYTTLACSFLGPTFTIAELREVYETLWGVSLHPSNFARKVTSSKGFLVETKAKPSQAETKNESSRRRYGRRFSRGPASDLSPPLRRDLFD